MEGILHEIALSRASPLTSCEALDNGTGERRVETTAADGGYRFVNLVPSNYKADIEQSGFRRYTRDEIAVNVEAAVRIDVALQVGDVTQAIEVHAGTAANDGERLAEPGSCGSDRARDSLERAQRAEPGVTSPRRGATG